jgi:hypothetical protein
MGVIGRLDEQVNEIIIKPVGERRRQESEVPLISAAERQPAPRTAGEEDRAQGEENHKARTQAELPVWLL